MDDRATDAARRRFLCAAGTLAATATLGPLLPARAHAAAAPVTLALRAGEGGRISERLVGLSYETLQMHDPAFFSRDNAALIGLLRRLNPHGVLRLGGNTSDYAAWSGYRGQLPPFPQLPHAVFKRPYLITPEQLSKLADFLHATDWRLIFGVNLGRDVPEMAAELAEAVQRVVGDRLLAIQIGNEPNDFKDEHGRLLSFEAYFERWQRTAAAVRQRVKVPLGGPDTGANTDWVLRFAEQVPDAALLSRHYYRGGAKEPDAGAAQLLAGDPGFFAELPQVAAATATRHTPFVLTEVNSYWSGGKLGVSNTLASALWGGDFALACAQAGVESLNFHGGVLSVLETSLDNSVAPKLDAGGSLQQRLDAISGRYTPIAGDINAGFYARPLYYGLLLAQQFGGARFMPVALQTGGINLTAYAAIRDTQRVVAVFNKDMVRDAEVRISLDTAGAHARVWRLRGASLDDVHGVSLAGAQVSGDGAWSPREQESVAVRDAAFALHVPRGSAALVWVGG
ncbi:glycosyl hydrolase family 79 C-terminal domain-containing protein [Dyella acidiphila]|uniref:Beta-glucuronidase C-terminal domain-containing protein n=1 Tax=Dyella acidiphila TaxID=2775866 RepID=A0ABR9G493_9GAMM|nr:glycosyl hydrolase family 79 C-terminal domain-containing protein [Dyella acidiphila]MBE1158876.1 hypothetical protein [Dyella acidiphila]